MNISEKDEVILSTWTETDFRCEAATWLSRVGSGSCWCCSFREKTVLFESPEVQMDPALSHSADFRLRVPLPQHWPRPVVEVNAYCWGLAVGRAVVKDTRGFVFYTALSMSSLIISTQPLSMDEIRRRRREWRAAEVVRSYIHVQLPCSAAQAKGLGGRF